MDLTLTFSTMLTMQEQINLRIHPNWREQNHKWYRAIWVECAELLDHYGWKWWKKQQQDLAQLQLELIDIWHFGLSDLLQHEKRHPVIAEDLILQLRQATDNPASAENYTSHIEKLVLETLQTKRFNAQIFFQLLPIAQLTTSNLFHTYLSKNVLNAFRQDHGYQQGDYQKQWHGLEDNEHLRVVMASVDLSHPQVVDNLYKGLKDIYSTLV